MTTTGHVPVAFDFLSPASTTSLSPSSSSSLDVDSEDDRSKNNDDEKIDVTKDDDEQAQGIVPQSSKASNKTTKFSNPAKSQEKSVAAKRTFPMSWKKTFLWLQFGTSELGQPMMYCEPCVVRTDFSSRLFI